MGPVVGIGRARGGLGVLGGCDVKLLLDMWSLGTGPSFGGVKRGLLSNKVHRHWDILFKRSPRD